MGRAAPGIPHARYRNATIDALIPAPPGLTSAEAARLLASEGPNAVADVTQHPGRRALLKLWAPVPWMLEAAIALQLGVGRYAEAGVVASLLLVNAALGFFQEGRAQATLDALKSRLRSGNVVIDGQRQAIRFAQRVAYRGG
jgi:H+-transporting ATPase